MSGEAVGVLGVIALFGLLGPVIAVAGGAALVVGAGVGIVRASQSISRYFKENEHKPVESVTHKDVSPSLMRAYDKALTDQNATRQRNQAAITRSFEDMTRQSKKAEQALQVQLARGGDSALEYVKTASRESVEVLTRECEKLTSEYIEPIRQTCEAQIVEAVNSYKADIESLNNTVYSLETADGKNQERLRTLTDAAIKDARNAVEIYETDFRARKFDAVRLAAVQTQLNAAITYYNEGMYQNALTTAMDVTSRTLGLSMRLNASLSEMEQRLALVAAGVEAVRARREEMRRIKFSVKGREYTEDIGVFSDGRIDKDIAELQKIEDCISTVKTTAEASVLQEKLSELTRRFDRNADEAILSLNNFYQRRILSGVIVGALKEQNYTFVSEDYENNNPLNRTCILFKNSVSDKSLLVSLVPVRTMGELTIELRLDSFDAASGEVLPAGSEVRRRAERCVIEAAIQKKCPGVPVEVHCTENTVNRNSNNPAAKASVERIREKLRSRNQNRA